MVYSNSSNKFMVLVAANSQDLKDSFVGSSCNFFSSFDDMNVSRMLLSFLFFNHSMKESIFFSSQGLCNSMVYSHGIVEVFPIHNLIYRLLSYYS